MGFVPGPLQAAGQGGTGAGGTDDRAKSGPIQPEDRNGGDACIDNLAFNGVFLTTSAAPAAGDAIPVGRMMVPAGGWMGTKRSSRSAPSGAAAPDPPPNG